MNEENLHQLLNGRRPLSDKNDGGAQSLSTLKIRKKPDVEHNLGGARHNQKRHKKLTDYFAKKLRRYQESDQSKLDRFYMIRKVVADKRLRVKGRFVTNDQALKLLGLTQEELKGSQEL